AQPREVRLQDPALLLRRASGDRRPSRRQPSVRLTRARRAPAQHGRVGRRGRAPGLGSRRPPRDGPRGARVRRARVLVPPLGARAGGAPPGGGRLTPPPAAATPASSRTPSP